MGATTTQLLQSNYFLPTFNMAIFDGPFRLYFSQALEPEALRLYFELHEIIGERVRKAAELSEPKKTLFVLLYPDEATFEGIFKTEHYVSDHWVGEAPLIAIKGPVWQSGALDHIVSRIGEFFGEKEERAFATAEA